MQAETTTTTNHHGVKSETSHSRLANQAAKLASLHIPSQSLVVTNIQDAVTAKMIAAHPSCAALAIASYVAAIFAGAEDDDLTPEQNLRAVDGIANVAREHGKPLTVDMQSGYGDRLGEAVRELMRRGVVGCNLEI